MKTLSDYRGEIDNIDSHIMALLEKRLELVRQVGVFKTERRLPPQDIQREKQVLAKINELLLSQEFQEDISKIYEVILERSLEVVTKASRLTPPHEPAHWQTELEAR